MILTDILKPTGIVAAMKATSKKQLIEELAAHASALIGLDQRIIFDALLQRERLGSTGIGNGIAIPHGKFPELTHLVGVFARLEKPVDFEALDGQPVDLVFLLLAPEDAGADHLKGLSKIARVLRDAGTTQRLRKAKDADVLYALLTRPSDTSIAA